MYSRNLGTGKGIELYRVPLDEKRPAIEYFYADKNALHYKTSHADEVRLNGKHLEVAEGVIPLSVSKTTEFNLETLAKGKVTSSQRVVVRRLKNIEICQAKDMERQGSASLNEDGSVEFKGEKGSSEGSVSWKVNIPHKGEYYLVVSYAGGNPVPSYLYINGEKISENIGYLATFGGKRGEFVFPVALAKGTNELRLEHPGRRSNRIYTVNIAKEIK